MQTVKIISVRQTPFITKSGFQKTEMVLLNNRKITELWVKITVASQKPYTFYAGAISAGISKKTIPITDTNRLLRAGEATTLKIELFKNQYCEGAPLSVYENKSWQRSRHWEFYISQTMHTDLGYTDYPETLRPLVSGYIDTVKQYIKNSLERTQESEKYKYAIESSWIMSETYAKQRNAEEIENFVDLVKQGYAAVGAGRYNNTSENFGIEEIARTVYSTNRSLRDRYGLPCDNTIRMFDNPAISKSYVDILNSAGIKYAIHSMNPDRSPYHKVREYDLFYMTGFNPENRLLVFNGKSYGENYGFSGNYINPKRGSAELAEKAVLDLIQTLEKRTGRRAFPYDKFPMPLIPFGDNKPPLEKQIKFANEVNKKWQSQGYAYPKITAAFPERFFEDVEKEYKSLIPVETATEENWWNDGWGTTAYESGINKKNSTLVPMAETMASLTSLLCGVKYPYTDLKEASERAATYNEHTWGFNKYKDCDEYHQQFEWKRSNALGANALAQKTLNGALKIMAESSNPQGCCIYVYNCLNCRRTDIVTVRLDENAPEAFEIISAGESIPYELKGNELTFVAKNVPAMGYRLFSLVSVNEKPVFKSKTTCSGNCVDSPFYRLTFDDDGTVKSIIDRKNSNREIVDCNADVKWNQYQYYDDFGIPFKNMGVKFSKRKWKLYQPDKESCTVEMLPTPLGMKIETRTSVFRAESICQTITVYDDIPRIDIDNKVIKSALPKLTDKEEAFYTFPFKADKDYEIRYDLPIGNAAEGEQIYGTSRDWYTAGKWVNVYDKSDDYSMTLSLINTSLLQFGERRTGKWSFDYKSEKPYIFSYVMNNMWQTNFQGDQPGTVHFSYSLFTGKGKSIQRINRSAWNTAAPLQAAVAFNSGKASGECPEEKSYLTISRDNVILTDMKASEANGEGMIVRFNEIAGTGAQNVTVRFPENITSVTETDIIENDIGKEQKGGTVAFSLKPYEMKTFRVKTDMLLPAVKGVKAVCIETGVPRSEHYQKERVKELTNGKASQQGVLVSWEKLENSVFYEVFRVKEGKTYFVGATEHSCLFDPQVTKDICGKYQYCVRAAGAGAKGKLSEKVTPCQGADEKGVIFEKPELYAEAREKSRIDLYWTPVQSVLPISHYEIYRNGVLIAKTPDNYVTSYRDYGVEFNNRYTYCVKAADTQGNLLESNEIIINHSDEFFAGCKSSSAGKPKRRIIKF